MYETKVQVKLEAIVRVHTAMHPEKCEPKYMRQLVELGIEYGLEIPNPEKLIGDYKFLGTMKV